MKHIDFNKITSKDLIDHSAMSEALKRYLICTLGYDNQEASVVASIDFKDPYSSPFVSQEYERKCSIDGKDYEVWSCRTDFCGGGLFYLDDVQPFEFYMLFDLRTLPDSTVGSYLRAQKMYIV